MTDHSNRPAGYVLRTVGAVAVMLCPAAATRRSILISPPLNGDLWIGPNGPLAVGVGIRLSTGAPPLKLCCCDLGRLITETWYAIAATPTETIAVVETYTAADEE